MSTVTMAGVRSRQIDAAGHSTRFLEAGDGPPVVLLHGSGPGVSAETNWSLTIPALAERFHILAPELVGFGGTSRADGLRYTLDLWVDHLLGFLDAVGLERVAVVGNSLGGIVTLHTAIRSPERLERIVLMGAPGIGMRMTPGLKALRAYEPSIEAMRDLLTEHFAYDRSIVSDDMIRRRYEASAIPGEAENYRAIHRGQASPDNPPLTEESVRAIEVPALLVHGRDDQVLDPQIAWTMANLLPDAELHLFPCCGHWAQIEHADGFNQIVGAFLARGTDEKGAA